MKQQTSMASSQTLASRAKPVRLADNHVLTGHAALALGICSTAIYISSAIVSFVTSYNQGAGREKLTLMLLGLLLPLALAVLVRHRIETVIGMLGVVLGLVAPVIGVAGMTMAAMDKGAAAGNLAVLVPLAGCGLVWALTRKNRVLLLLLGACLIVAAGVVFASGEHSAILGLTVGAFVSFGFFWRHRIADRSPWLYVLDVAVIVLALLLMGIYLSLILMPERLGPIGQILPPYYAQRFAAWRDTPEIISDYLFTGGGLGAAPMVLSSYLFMVHVPFFYHVHNLFLQIGIEQGLPGIIGLAGMFVAAFWSMTAAVRRAHAYVALCAASVFASLLSLCVSGLFESDVYAGAWVVVMFMPFGFAWVIAQYDVSGRASRDGTPNRPQPVDLVIGAIPLLLLIGLAVWPSSRAQWLANLGTLVQTRVELANYVIGISHNRDDFRREPSTDLDRAIDLYGQALAQDSNNATALRRLAQIEIARGEYSTALEKLERAQLAAPGQRATRQMLGEMYAVDGRLDEAAALWKTIVVGPQLLQNRYWWYEHIGDIRSADNMRSVLQQLGQ